MGKRSKFWWTAVLSAVIGLAVEEKTIGQARRKAMRRLEEDDMKFHEFMPSFFSGFTCIMMGKQ